MKLTKGIYAPLLWIALFAAVATAPVWVPALSAGAASGSTDASTVRVAAVRADAVDR
jgi:hypothetical protein